MNDIEIIWLETNHQWDGYGEVSKGPELDDDLHAKGIVIWKKQSLNTLVEKISRAVKAGIKYSVDENTLAGLILTMTVVNLLPLYVKIIKDDAAAALFLRLLKSDDDGSQFFEKQDLSEPQGLVEVIEYFVNVGVLERRSDRLYVAGKVLNRSHQSS